MAIGVSTLSEKSVNIDNSYKKITGVRAYTLTDGDLPYYEIGLKDRDQVYHNLSNNADWAPVVGHQYKPLNIENRGQDFIISIKPAQAVATTELKVHLVFVLEN